MGAAVRAWDRDDSSDQSVFTKRMRRSFRRIEWSPIDDAPRDGRTVTLGWLAHGVAELEMTSRWIDGCWEGNWNPTHWRPR
jgi:hypothetical protein